MAIAYFQNKIHQFKIILLKKVVYHLLEGLLQASISPSARSDSSHPSHESRAYKHQSAREGLDQLENYSWCYIS